jgi:hypothetical protein
VGEESKLARSFERLRSIVRKKRQGREKTENEQNMRLEEMVREVMTRHAAKECYNAANICETVIGRTVDHKHHTALGQETGNLQCSQQAEGVGYTPAGQEVEENCNSQLGSSRHTPTFPRVVNSIVTGELEERMYSVSCHEALNKHAEDKRYSLVLPKSVLINVQESEDDKRCSASSQDTMKKGILSDQEDSMLRPLVDRQLSVTTHQTESKGENFTLQFQVIWPLLQDSNS